MPEMKNKKYFLISAVVIIFFALQGFEKEDNSYKISNRLREELSLNHDAEKILTWVKFTDKGSNTQYLLNHPELYLTERSLERRKKVFPANRLSDNLDLPLNQNYVNDLKNSGIEIRQKSKWFNSVSCYLTKLEVFTIAERDFVEKIELVGKFRRSDNDIEFTNNNFIPESEYSGIPDETSSFNYGASQTQMQLINCVTAHDSGYAGQGVVIASFDAGFDNLSHPVFDSIEARGFRTYDFVNHDTIVANQSGQMGEGSHGTQTLSLVGGFRSGNLISPAYRSRYLLAKTENTDSETPVEEDNWIAAAEWADSLGADIITSSLGYIDMDPGSIRSYDWTWMNGDSCFITIGADIAVSRGIIVCNSAGNEGYHSTHNTLAAPSDGDSVFCIGSVNSTRVRSSFSSVGLSVDGRIKPDVCAMGSGNTVAMPGAGNTGYTTGSGTSFSCPMTAGVCAVILSANYNMTPMQVMNLLRQTADSSFAPNRRRGWGLINCWESVKLAKLMTGTSVVQTIQPEGYYLSQNYPNPFNPVTNINYELRVNNYELISLKIFDMLGKEVAVLVNERKSSGNYSVEFTGSNFPSGVYYYSLIIDGKPVDTRKMLLVK